VAETLHAGVQAALEAIDSGAAADKLEQFVEHTHQLAGPASATS
jgi:anthranilate phosphoribosyltransferase